MQRYRCLRDVSKMCQVDGLQKQKENHAKSSDKGQCHNETVLNDRDEVTVVEEVTIQDRFFNNDTLIDYFEHIDRDIEMSQLLVTDKYKNLMREYINKDTKMLCHLDHIQRRPRSFPDRSYKTTGNIASHNV